MGLFKRKKKDHDGGLRPIPLIKIRSELLIDTAEKYLEKVVVPWLDKEIVDVCCRGKLIMDKDKGIQYDISYIESLLFTALYEDIIGGYIQSPTIASGLYSTEQMLRAFMKVIIKHTYAAWNGGQKITLIFTEDKSDKIVFALKTVEARDDIELSPRIIDSLVKRLD